MTDSRNLFYMQINSVKKDCMGKLPPESLRLGSKAIVMDISAGIKPRMRVTDYSKSLTSLEITCCHV